MAHRAAKIQQEYSKTRPPSQASLSVTPSSVGLEGEPIQIVAVVEDHGFELVEDNLVTILSQHRVKDKPVVVVSVAGAFRKGKSFLLNFFIRYLTYYTKNGYDTGWLGDQTIPLAGFNWRGGAERETTGILMWSEPFILTNSTTGEEVVVLLMDTQGAFDTESTVKQCATIFALSTMLASVQVYNIHSNIQENDLQHLQLFTEYGKLAVVADGVADIKPFQSLLFLVRDWSYPYDNPYGIEGGNYLLDIRLKLSENQHPELQLLRQQIRNCFETIDCFLMPHPGLKVSTNPRFDGRVSDIDGDFIEQLGVLVPQLLSPDNLIVKEISGNRVTCRDLIEYFKVYMRIFSGDDLPEPKSLMHATAEANNLVALSTAKSLYQSRMDATCGGDRPFLHPDQLTEAHESFFSQAIEAFHSVKKMGGLDFSVSYLEVLKKDINDMWEQYCKSNEAKSMLHTMRTPITLFLSFLFSYLLSGLTAAIGVTPLTSLLNAVILISLVLLATWCYCRQTGELREVGTSIDSLTSTVWDLLSGPAHNLAQRSISKIAPQYAGLIPGGSNDSNLRRRLPHKND